MYTLVTEARSKTESGRIATRWLAGEQLRARRRSAAPHRPRCAQSSSRPPGRERPHRGNPCAARSAVWRAGVAGAGRSRPARSGPAGPAGCRRPVRSGAPGGDPASPAAPKPTRLPAASVPVTASPGPAAPVFGAPLSPQPVRAEVAAARPAPSRVRRATGMPEIVTAGPKMRHLTRPNVGPVRPIGQQVVIWRTLSVDVPAVVRRSAGITSNDRPPVCPRTVADSNRGGHTPRYPLGEHDVPLPVPGLRRAECGSTP